jgi:hypothetical protein
MVIAHLFNVSTTNKPYTITLKLKYIMGFNNVLFKTSPHLML